MRKLGLLIPSCIVFALLGCKKDNGTLDFHHNYFPLKEGTFIEYKVTSIKHDAFASIHDTTVYLMKTVIGDTIIDNEGRIARKFYRYFFDTLDQKYKIHDLWTVLIDRERAELVEDNQRKIKLIFSPTKYKQWNVNAFNDSVEIQLYYDGLHVPYNLNNLNFDSTIMVKEDIQPNAIHYYEKYEVYAKNIGLIKLHFQDYSLTFGEISPMKGSELFYEILNYGVE